MWCLLRTTSSGDRGRRSDASFRANATARLIGPRRLYLPLSVRAQGGRRSDWLIPAPVASLHPDWSLRPLGHEDAWYNQQCEVGLGHRVSVRSAVVHLEPAKLPDRSFSVLD